MWPTRSRLDRKLIEPAGAGDAAGTAGPWEAESGAGESDPGDPGPGELAFVASAPWTWAASPWPSVPLMANAAEVTTTIARIAEPRYTTAEVDDSRGLQRCDPVVRSQASTEISASSSAAATRSSGPNGSGDPGSGPGGNPITREVAHTTIAPALTAMATLA